MVHQTSGKATGRQGGGQTPVREGGSRGRGYYTRCTAGSPATGTGGSITTGTKAEQQTEEETRETGHSSFGGAVEAAESQTEEEEAVPG